MLQNTANQYLRKQLNWKLAKAYEIMFAKTCKPWYFCTSIFAKACKSTCILHLWILVKTQFAKTLQNVVKGVLMLAPPPPPPPLLRPSQEQHQPPQPGHPQRLQTICHHHPKTHCKCCFLSLVCPKCSTIQVCQPTYDEIQSQLLSCFKCIG